MFLIAVIMRFEEYTFSFPVGLSLFHETVLIADKSNHAIRSLNLAQSVVSTYFVSGEPGHRNGNGFASELKAPYDLKMDQKWDIIYC